jgi:hypothetical protein
MHEKSELAASGQALVDFAKSQPHSARGAVTDLFPYIYEAAGRMSTRAISAFLQEEQLVAISPSTVLRALREADPFFDDYLDEIEVAFEVLKETYGKDEALALLTDEAKYRQEDANPPAASDITGEDSGAAQSALDRALGTLRRAWWVGGPRYRREALKRFQRRLAGATPAKAEQPKKRRK